MMPVCQLVASKFARLVGEFANASAVHCALDVPRSIRTPLDGSDPNVIEKSIAVIGGRNGFA